jgi:hypothetical protein
LFLFGFGLALLAIAVRASIFGIAGCARRLRPETTAFIRTERLGIGHTADGLHGTRRLLDHIARKFAGRTAIADLLRPKLDCALNLRGTGQHSRPHLERGQWTPDPSRNDWCRNSRVHGEPTVANQYGAVYDHRLREKDRAWREDD